MKVLILEANEIKDFNDSYASRLIEQGKAVIPPKAEPKKTPSRDDGEPKPAKGKHKECR